MSRKKNKGPAAEGKRQVKQNRRFTIEHQFAVADWRVVRDPFVGLLWELGRIGLQPYQEFLKQNQKRSPLYAAMTKSVLTAAVMQAGKRKRKEKAKGGNGGVSTDAVMEQALNDIDWSKVDLKDVAAKEGVALHLIKSISSDEESAIEFGVVQRACSSCGHTWDDLDIHDCGECGSDEWSEVVEPVAYSPEAGQQILENTSPLRAEVLRQVFPPESDEEDDEVRGLDLGDAVYAWILREVTDTEAYRIKHLKRGVENLEPSSAGG